MAWRDKLLIKGLEHSASEYLVTGKAAQPTQERALFLPTARVGWGAGICATPRPQRVGPQAAVSVGSCSSQLCWALGVTGLLLQQGTSPGQEHQPLWLVQQ